MPQEYALEVEPPVNDPTYTAIPGQGVNRLMLPDEQQALLNWLGQRESVRLSEVALHLGQTQTVAYQILQTLVEQGFVQEISPFLKPVLAGDVTREQRHSDSDGEPESALVAPLTTIISPSGDSSAAAGSTFELIVTVFNRGDRNAVVDVFIDETVQAIRRWCESPSERLALGVGQSNEVIFRFQIPAQALPAIHTYQVIIDSPDHYPEDTPLQYTKKLQITPQFETLAKVNDPTFTLFPVTRSAQPAVLQPGATLEVKVQVHNRSDRVDRFRLTCPDLNREWFTVRYPEGIETPGLITTTDGLRLNPNSYGEILLYITPPLDAPAGSYTPTLRLHSVNNPELNLLDVVYFEVAPIYRLVAELQTQISKIRHLPALYKIRLTNSGNIKRNLILNIRNNDEDDALLYGYTWNLPTPLTPSASSLLPSASPAILSPSPPVHILPKQSLEVGLQVKPTRWWRRPWFGAGRVSTFVITLEDRQRLPVSTDPLQGTLVWKARPWWQFLLLLLTSLGGVALLGFLIWHFFFRPIAPSKVLEFASEELSYQEEEGKPIRLKWQISSPSQIGSLVITTRSQQDGSVLSTPVSYDFRQGIPKALEPLCTVDRLVLTCRNVPSDARKAGSYVFSLQISARERMFGRRGVMIESAKTDPIAISPIAQPQITQYSATVSSKGIPVDASSLSLQQRATSVAASNAQTFILQSWKVTNPTQIAELQVLGRDPEGAVNSKLHRFKLNQGIPELLIPYCSLTRKELACQNVPFPVANAGDYIFELAVLSKQPNLNSPISKKTDTLKIEPTAPRILSFQINGREAFPKYVVPLDRRNSVRVLELAWNVEKANGIKVELLPTPGSVPLRGTMAYPLVQQPGITTLTLQVTNAAGKQIRRAIELQVFDPNASKPVPAPRIVLSAPSPVAPVITVPTPTSAPTTVAPAPSSVPTTVPSSAPEVPSLPTEETPTPVEVPSRFN